MSPTTTTPDDSKETRLDSEDVLTGNAGHDDLKKDDEEQSTKDQHATPSVSESNVQNRPTSTDVDSEQTKPDAAVKSKRGVRFWLIMVALCSCGILASVDGTVMSTALPSITNELGGGDLSTWAINAYFLTSTALLPFYGQMANVIGRRYPLIFAVVIFIVGSGICAGANAMATLVAGRLVQGLGGAGLNMLIELIICDLVPLRERGNYMGILMSSLTVGTALGPFIGGIIVQRTTWRWVFYLNLPIGGIALTLLILFLQVGYKKQSTVKEKLERIDWTGNFLFISSVVAVLIGVTWGGSTYPWSSYHVLVPLIIGFVGLGAFQIYEGTRFCVEPLVPPRMFANRTSLVAIIVTFIHSILGVWSIYFLAIYFQAVMRSSPSRSGVQLLPVILVLIPGAAVGGFILAKFGRYRPIHQVAFTLMTIGLGLFILLDESSSTAVWVIVQIVFGIGGGLAISCLLPAFQAGLSDADSAASTGIWAFVRGFGMIWGVTIPAVTFSNQFNNRLDRIGDADTRAKLSGDQAYSLATNTFINSLGEPTQSQVVSVYSDSLQVVWIVGTALSGLGFLLVFLEKEIKMRTELETEYGMTEKTKATVDPEDRAMTASS